MAATKRGLTPGQRRLLLGVAVLFLPALCRRAWKSYQEERSIDLSRFDVRTKPFDTPAIERMDGKVHIEFCTS